ncbi:MAG TPA: addiction module protein [Acidiferrobacterales bacterium]|nr:addiction module protein [Acidiferrobacterales bacterium]
MARPLKEIEQELLHLPQAERARLAHRLIVSLDEDLPPDEGIEAAWIEEIKRRDAEIERGDVQTIPAEEAMRRVSEALKKNKK